MARSNLQTTLKRRRRPDPMGEFDALPAPLRGWLARASLPFSARSALRLWQGALRDSGGDATRALDRLTRAEHHMLRRDAPAIWGPTHPGVSLQGCPDPSPPAGDTP